MLLQTIDWVMIFAFFALSLAIGLLVARRAGSSTAEFFLSGRRMPWWLLGVSMVATTFSTDTPNLVTDIVRKDGVAGNWAWWAFLLTGMLTVFVYAKLWRRSGVMTDIEFYELRYSGKTAAFLRCFRALYLGVFFNVVVMASVTLAAIKIGSVMLNLTPLQTVLVASVVTVIYSMLGGLRGVMFTDFFQFFVAMFGAIVAAVVALRQPEVGGLARLLAHPNLSGKLAVLPDFTDTQMVMTLLVIPLAVQWWSVWYPGAEPGGGGYLAQRMLAAKDEKNAVGATFLFNVAHYALRPWPWIIVALCSLLVFPSLESLQAAFPHIDAKIVKHDLAYPAMLTFLPAGLLGLVLASLIAAYMSTISTHLNWGSSYIVNDVWKRFLSPNAGEKELVRVGRTSTVVLMILAAVLAGQLEHAKEVFDLILQIGAGTGLLFILRWFWWRVNAVSEITAMVVSFLVALAFFIQGKMDWPGPSDHVKLCLGVAITTASWVLVTFLTKPADEGTLRRFFRLVRPGGPGWNAVLRRAEAEGEPIQADGRGWDLPMGILRMVFGCFAVYSALFATGYWIYGRFIVAVALSLLALLSAGMLALSFWPIGEKSSPAEL